MMSGSPERALHLFVMANLLTEHALDRVEADYGIALNRGHRETASVDKDYYPQIEKVIRIEAAQMAPHYEVFYSLEKTIRGLVRDVLEEDEGAKWWVSERVPTNIRDECEKRIKRELDAGTTVRSTDPLDFSTFGELGEIIKRNWDLFGGQFTSKRAIQTVMGRLNTLRGPIAHCSPLAEDEVLRLQLSVRDWFRLME